MSASSAATSADSAWLHCSPARTVWWHRGPGDEPDVIEKIYVSGSMAEAEHEFTMGQLAAGTGVVAYLAAKTDAQGNRPAVTVRHERGENLEARVAAAGAIPATEALLLLAPIARTLARLHQLRTPELPNGMCHGDVKPQNLLLTPATTLLLDFEHARAIGTPSVARAPDRDFTGGTSAYSPPEASHGRSPDEAFDIFGLGRSLRFLLDGGRVNCLPHDLRLEQCIAACCAEDPTQRPSAADLADRFEQLRMALLDDPAEVLLDDWATGTLGAAEAVANATSDPRTAPWSRRQRLIRRLPQMLQRPAGLPTDPDGLGHELHLTDRVLARFPRHRATLRRRAELLRAAGSELIGAAATMHAHSKAEEFDAARQWLVATERLITTALAMPRGLATVTQTATDQTPGAMQRAPIEYLGRLLAQVEGQQQELQQQADQISVAERELDLVAAEHAIDTMAGAYGGTSPTVAQRRDQLHRLAFYLDRIARAQPNVERVGPLWDPIALQPLRELVSAAAQAVESRTRREGHGGAVGLRSLQLTLANLAEEFPHLDQVPASLEALTQALGHLTEQAWQQLAKAEQRLQIVPVPVRPLKLALGRLDTFRMLEAFVDHPDHPRSELLDGLERLRLGLEQARSARDRLAENAEHALARGHWTTGLFDMERAVAGLNPGDDQERGEAERLRERLQAARRTKQEIETAVRRNVELTASYAALEDEPQSTFSARLQVLEERRDCLIFLGMHVPNERALLYRNDLRGVETIIAVEQAALAEQQLDAASDPVARLRLTRDMLERLSTTTTSSDGNRQHGLEPPGRMVRLLEHWRTLTTQCQKAVDDVHRERHLQARHRRRMWTIAILALVVSTTAIGFAIKPLLFGEPALASERDDTPRDGR